MLCIQSPHQGGLSGILNSSGNWVRHFTTSFEPLNPNGKGVTWFDWFSSFSGRFFLVLSALWLLGHSRLYHHSTTLLVQGQIWNSPCISGLISFKYCTTQIIVYDGLKICSLVWLFLWFVLQLNVMYPITSPIEAWFFMLIMAHHKCVLSGDDLHHIDATKRLA